MPPLPTRGLHKPERTWSSKRNLWSVSVACHWWLWLQSEFTSYQFAQKKQRCPLCLRGFSLKKQLHCYPPPHVVSLLAKKQQMTCPLYPTSSFFTHVPHRHFFQKFSFLSYKPSNLGSPSVEKKPPQVTNILFLSRLKQCFFGRLTKSNHVAWCLNKNKKHHTQVRSTPTEAVNGSTKINLRGVLNYCVQESSSSGSWSKLATFSIVTSAHAALGARRPRKSREDSSNWINQLEIWWQISGKFSPWPESRFQIG